MMIKDETEYKVSLQRLGRLTADYAALLAEPNDPTIDPILARAELDGVRNRLITALEELADYERKNNVPAVFAAHSLAVVLASSQGAAY